MNRSLILFGSTGLLGSALLRELVRGKATPALPVRWAGIPRAPGDFDAWAERSLVLPTEGVTECTVVIANGITDPKQDPAAILESNVEFPKRLASTLRAHGRFRFLTIGTIFENFPKACEANPYLRSKLELGRWMAAQAESHAGATRFLHVRLHTIYGRRVPPHMFLGQMAGSLAKGRPFAMSSGEQMREYHHADDVACSLEALLARPWGEPPVASPVEISSGEPVRLADLARGVFRAFGRESDLRIGAIAGPASDNRESVFPRSPAWLLPKSRPPIEGVIEVLRQSLRENGWKPGSP